MARIKIEDLARDVAITEDDMRRLRGGPSRRIMENMGIGAQVDPVLQHQNVLDLRGLAVNPYVKYD